MTSIWGKKDKQGKKIFNLPKHSLWFSRPATPFFIRFHSLEKNGQFSLLAFERLSRDSLSPEPGGLLIGSISTSPAVTQGISTLLQQHRERLVGCAS